MKKKVDKKNTPEKEIVAETVDEMHTPVKDLLFKKFKKSPGMKVFIIKFKNDHEKVIFNKVLTALKDRNYLSYALNFSNIQIFLTDAGRKIVDTQEQWEVI